MLVAINEGKNKEAGTGLLRAFCTHRRHAPGGGGPRRKGLEFEQFLEHFLFFFFFGNQKCLDV